MIKNVFKGLVGIIFLMVFSLGLLISRPELLGKISLSPHWVNKFLPPGFSVWWKNLTVKARSTSSLREKTFELSFLDLCLSTGGEEVLLCFEKGHLPLRIKIAFSGLKGKLKSVHVGRSRFSGGKLWMKKGKEEIKEKENEKEKSWEELWTAGKNVLESLPPVTLSFLGMEFLNVSYESEADILEGPLEINGKWPAGPAGDFFLSLAAQGWKGGPLVGGKNALQVTLASEEGIKEALKLRVKGKVGLKGSQKIQLSLESDPIFPRKEKLFPLGLGWEGQAQRPEESLTGKGHILLAEKTWRTDLRLSFRSTARVIKKKNPEFHLNYLDLKNFSLVYDFDGPEELKGHQGRIQAKGDLSAGLVGMPVSFPLFPRHIKSHLQLAAQLPRGTQGPWRGGFQMDLSPIVNQHGEIRSQMKVDFEGQPSDWAQGKGIKGGWQLFLGVRDFQLIRKTLDEQNILVPAPLHVLQGPIRFEMAAKFPSPSGSSLLWVPFLLRTDLTSPNQVLKTQFQGEFSLQEKGGIYFPILDSQWMISEMQLRLPSLIPRPPINIFPDPRIVRASPPPDKKTKTKPKWGKLSLNLRVSTVHDGALELLTALSNEALPLSLNFSVKDNAFKGGTLRIHHFDMNLFRKDAELNFLNLGLRPKMANSELLGEMVVKYVDYTVTVKVVGTVEQPQVLFESRPPLSQENIMSVLLFGKPLDQLTGTEGDSVSSMQAAAAEGAITLATLYFLAATPVESIGYNPDTKRLSAKVRLGQRTSLTLGAEEAAYVDRIGVRRQLGRNFAIRTEVRRDEDWGDNQIWTFLEWFRRY